MKDCASRLFMVRMKLGEFDPPEMNPYKKYVQTSCACSLKSYILSLIACTGDQYPYIVHVCTTFYSLRCTIKFCLGAR